MLRFALVGCGRISKRHAELLGGNKVKGAKLVAVCDPISLKANYLAQEYGINSYTNIASMMENEQIDVVSILTESGNHAKHATEVASYGKHVVVEKPMALTLDDADMMIEACDNAGIKLFVIKQNRFNLPVQKLRSAIEEGRFKKLVLGTVRVRWCRKQDYYDQDAWRGTWSLDGGVLTNQSIHHIDLLTWMMGPVESVFAKTSTALVNIEAEDTAAAVLKFRNGALGIVEATTATRPRDLEGSLSILGEAGSVVIGGFAVNKLTQWNFVDSDESCDDMLEAFSQNPPDVYGFGHLEYYNHVVNCIRDGGPNLVDGLEGRKSIELVNAFYESSATGKEVRLSFSPTNSKLGRSK
tara:strand:- start:165 stop:1226 length:1062 start_codon:yes stop_codon:yes gene_type:complete